MTSLAQLTAILLVLVVAKEDADKAASALNGEGMGARVIGEIVPGGEDRVVLC